MEGILFLFQIFKKCIWWRFLVFFSWFFLSLSHFSGFSLSLSEFFLFFSLFFTQIKLSWKDINLSIYLSLSVYLFSLSSRYCFFFFLFSSLCLFLFPDPFSLKYLFLPFFSQFFQSFYTNRYINMSSGTKQTTKRWRRKEEEKEKEEKRRKKEEKENLVDGCFPYFEPCSTVSFSRSLFLFLLTISFLLYFFLSSSIHNFISPASWLLFHSKGSILVQEQEFFLCDFFILVHISLCLMLISNLHSRLFFSLSLLSLTQVFIHILSCSFSVLVLNCNDSFSSRRNPDGNMERNSARERKRKNVKERERETAFCIINEG